MCIYASKLLQSIYSWNNIPDAMQVTVSVRRAIIVDDDVDTFDIDTTTEDIGCHENTLFKGFECRVTSDTAGECGSDHKCKRINAKYSPFFLRQTRVNSDRREIARHEQFIQLDCARNGFDEDNDLYRR